MVSARNFCVPLTDEVKSLRSSAKPAPLKRNAKLSIHRYRDRIGAGNADRPMCT